MKDRIRYIPSIIMLVAGLVACIVTFINHYKPLESMITILAKFPYCNSKKLMYKRETFVPRLFI